MRSLPGLVDQQVEQPARDTGIDNPKRGQGQDAARRGNLPREVDRRGNTTVAGGMCSTARRMNMNELRQITEVAANSSSDARVTSPAGPAVRGEAAC